MSDLEQFVEIRVRQQDGSLADPIPRTISCTGSFACSEFFAPGLLERDEALDMCTVRNGSVVEVDGLRYSCGELPANLVSEAATAVVGCDSEAVLLVGESGAIYDSKDYQTLKPLLPDTY